MLQNVLPQANTSHLFQSLTVFPEVILSHPIIRTLPGFMLYALCSTKGTPPVYTALTRTSTVLTNTTHSDVTIRLHEEGNYSCVATGKYGADVKDFSVIFNGEIFFDRKHLTPFFSTSVNYIIFKVALHRGWCKKLGIHNKSIPSSSRTSNSHCCLVLSPKF